MRGATGVTLQPHQILRLPRKMTLMIDPSRIWNVIYNKRSNRCHLPTSPNIAPAPQNDSHDRSCSHIKRHLQCAEQQEPHQILRLQRKIAFQNLRKMYLIRAWSDHGPTMKFAEVTFRASETHFVLKFRLMIDPARTNEMWVMCDFTELLLDWAFTWLTCYFTELLLDWAVTWLNCYLTELFLDWTGARLSCYRTELLFYWTVTWLSCHFTELLLDWTVTLLSCYFTELLLYWSVTLLSCYFTEPLLFWAVILLNC